MKKMIAFDLGGTLLNTNFVCSEKSLDYLEKLKKDGYIIVVATGKMFKSALSATNNASFANYVISDNGCCIYNSDTKKFIYKELIPKKLINSITRFYDKYDYLTICTTNDIYKIDIDNNFINKLNTIVLNCDGITHIVINFKDINDIYNIKNSLCSEIPELEFFIMQDSFSDNKWLDIYMKKNSKYNSLLKIMNLENISNDDVICFGDSSNDIEMLKKCGIGVAMKNALDEVKEVADYITLSNNEDGVIYFLEKYLKNY